MSDDHHRVFRFLEKLYRKFISRVETFYDLLLHTIPEVMVAFTISDPEYVEDIRQLQDSLSSTLQRLTETLDCQGEFRNNG